MLAREYPFLNLNSGISYDGSTCMTSSLVRPPELTILV